MNKEPQREEGSKIICAYFFCNTTVRYANFFRSIYFAQYCLLLLGISSCNHIQPSVKHDAEIDICYDLAKTREKLFENNDMSFIETAIDNSSVKYFKVYLYKK